MGKCQDSCQGKQMESTPLVTETMEGLYPMFINLYIDIELTINYICLC